MATFLSLFDHKAREHSKLSRQEVHAITAFLTARVKEFALFEAAPSQLRQLVQHSTVIDVDEESSDSAMSDDSVDLLAQVREVWPCNRACTDVMCIHCSRRSSCQGVHCAGYCSLLHVMLSVPDCPNAVSAHRMLDSTAPPDTLLDACRSR